MRRLFLLFVGWLFAWRVPLFGVLSMGLLAVGSVQKSTPGAVGGAASDVGIEPPQHRRTPATAPEDDGAYPASTPADAVRMALADLAQVAPQDRPCVRYVWVPDGDHEMAQLVALALNYVSRATVVVLPPIVAGGHLVRVDLRWYWPRDRDTVDAVNAWEKLAFDPTWSVLLTKDTLRYVDRGRIPRRKRTVTRTVRGTPGIPATSDTWREERREIDWPGGRYVYPDDTGRVVEDLAAYPRYNIVLRFRVPGTPAVLGTPDREVIEVVDEEVTVTDDVVRVNGAHVEPGLRLLQEATLSQAPVVRAEYFVSRALTTIQDSGNKAADDGVFRTVWSGLYYEFRGIKLAKDVLGVDTKATDEDLFFESIGIGNIRAGVTADVLFERLRGDQRAAMARSKVTYKPRRVDMFQTPATREGTSWGAITHDLSDEAIDVGTHPLANLLRFQDNAREGIFPGVNGMPQFTMFNGRGARQNEVPFNVAADTTIPEGHTKRLQSFGCIVCHSSEDGWRSVPNDVQKLIRGKRTPDIFGDLGVRGMEFSPDTIDRLAGLYAGSYDKHLRRARDDYAEVLLRAGGPWRSSKSGQTDVVQISGQRFARARKDYWYDTVDAQRACLELGVRTSVKNATATLQRLLPPDIRGDAGAGFVPEDFRLAYLKQGVAISRSDWSLAYGFAAERSQRTRVAVVGAKP